RAHIGSCCSELHDRRSGRRRKDSIHAELSRQRGAGPRRTAQLRRSPVQLFGAWNGLWRNACEFRVRSCRWEEPADSASGAATLLATRRASGKRPHKTEGQFGNGKVKVALLYNARTAPGSDLPDDTFEEYDSDATISGIASALHGIHAEVE